MNAPSVDMVILLAASSTGLTAGTDLFYSLEPDGTSVVDKIVTVFDTGGLEPVTYATLLSPNILVRIRGDAGEFVEGEALAQVVRNTLHGVANTTVGGTRYISIIASTDINFLGYDDNNRPLWSINFRLMRTA
jgi:hypothetical protein